MQIGHYSKQINLVMTNKNGLTQAVNNEILIEMVLVLGPKSGRYRQVLLLID